jgi:CRP/FNR family transcriptional regulator, cyclic AMP receptor protein
MENLGRLLREHLFLKDLSPEQAEHLISCAKNARFQAGEFLMREGQAADTFFLLRKGRVALEISVPGKGAVQMESLEEGDMLGLSWLFPPYRVHLDARAVEPVVAIAFDGTCLRGKMESDHELGYALLRIVLQETVKRIQRVRMQRLDVFKAD